MTLHGLPNFRSIGPTDQPAERTQTHTHHETDATENITSSANAGGNKSEDEKN